MPGRPLAADELSGRRHRVQGIGGDDLAVQVDLAEHPGGQRTPAGSRSSAAGRPTHGRRGCGGAGPMRVPRGRKGTRLLPQQRRPACATAGSAPAACSPAPASSRSAARASSASASNKQECTRPPTAQTPTSPCAAQRPAASGKPSATPAHSDTNHLTSPGPKMILVTYKNDVHPILTAGRRKCQTLGVAWPA